MEKQGNMGQLKSGRDYLRSKGMTKHLRYSPHDRQGWRLGVSEATRPLTYAPIDWLLDKKALKEKY